MRRVILIAVGFFALFAGAVGVALPVLPTTPFVLLAALCFSRANERLFRWLGRNRIFGPYIENYRTKQGISPALKAGSIAFLWAGLGVSISRTEALWIHTVLALIGIAVTIHLLKIKTKKGI